MAAKVATTVEEWLRVYVPGLNIVKPFCFFAFSDIIKLVLLHNVT